MRFAIVAVLCAVALAPAAEPVDPLALMPREAGFVLKVEKPRTLIESYTKLDAYGNLKQFPQVREVLESTNVRRFFQLVAHLEKETGQKWPDLIDRIAGDGIAIGIAVGTDPAPALLIVQGTDEECVAKTYDLVLAGIIDGGKTAARTGTIGKVKTTHVGDDFHTARVGKTLYFANKEAALKAGLKRPTGVVADVASLKAARKLVGPDAVAWAWLDLAKVKESQASKDFFEASRKDILQTLVIGSSVDAARRANFLAAGLYRTDAGFTLSIRLPAKRADLDDAMSLHVPKAGNLGSKPLLVPEGVIASQSFYLDLGHIWKNRATMVNDEVRPQIEAFDKEISRVLPGTSFGELLAQMGPHHRLVMAHTGEKLYARTSEFPVPPVAYIASMRDRSFAKTMDGILRGGAFLAGFQTGWAMKEETVEGTKIVSYRFPEAGEPKFDDPQNLRFNAVPSFAAVGDSLVVASSPGLVKRLIPLLKNEIATEGSPSVWRASAFAAGAGLTLAANPEPTITQTILQQGIGLAEARAQVAAIAKWLPTLGAMNLRMNHDPDVYKFDFDWTFGK